MKQYKNKKAMALLMAAVLAGSALYNGVADAASAIKLNKKTAKIAVGKSVTLKVRGTKKKVKWKSLKKSVATVNAKGKVTGKKAGKAVVTAKVKGMKRHRRRLRTTTSVSVVIFSIMTR